MDKNQNNFRKSSATIYQTQWQIIKNMPKNQKLAVLEMLIEYEMLGIEPDEAFFRKFKNLEVFWLMSKPLIDKRVKRAESGRKGGQNSRKNRDSEEKNKQTVSKTKANDKQTVSKNKQTESKPKADKDIDLDIEEEDISKDISISETARLDGGGSDGKGEIPEGWTEQDEEEFQMMYEDNDWKTREAWAEYWKNGEE